MEKVTDDRAKTFGSELAKARQRADLTQAVLAERAGIKPSTLSSWERGEFEPPPDAVFEIERALKVRPGALSHHLGYVPVDAAMVEEVRAMMLADTATRTVEEVVLIDPTLNDYRRGLLLEIYKTLQEGGG